MPNGHAGELAAGRHRTTIERCTRQLAVKEGAVVLAVGAASATAAFVPTEWVVDALLTRLYCVPKPRAETLCELSRNTEQV